MNNDKIILAALTSASYVFAKTMPDDPHEYTVRHQWAAQRLFDDSVTYIRENGKSELYKNTVYVCFYHDGYKYWTMGNPIAETTIINRATIL